MIFCWWRTEAPGKSGAASGWRYPHHMSDRFGGLSDKQESDLVKEIWNWFINTDKRDADREEHTQRRHDDWLDRFDLAAGAVIAGLRATADRPDRNLPRRKRR